MLASFVATQTGVNAALYVAGAMLPSRDILTAAVAWSFASSWARAALAARPRPLLPPDGALNSFSNTVSAVWTATGVGCAAAAIFALRTGDASARVATCLLYTSDAADD